MNENRDNQNTQRNNDNKTLVIIIIAILLLISCLLFSCCAGSIYILTRTDTKKVLDSMTFENSRGPQAAETVSAPEKEGTSEDESTALTEVPEEPTATDEAKAEPAVTDETPEETENISGKENAAGISGAVEEDRAANTSDLTVEQIKIVERTEKVRGLHAEKPLAPIYKTEDELRQYLMDEIYKDEQTDYERFYRILGLIPEEFDLKQFYIDLYTEQIAGYYDPETDQMYLISGLSEDENNATIAHEYTHYLQYHDPVTSEVLIKTQDDEFAKENGEIVLVLDAISEGDATLVEMLTESVDEDSDDASSVSSTFLDTAPKFILDSMLFPYQYGFNFVWYTYMKGGFDAVNDLYNNVPESVEQILHPEKYMKDAPIDIEIAPFRSRIEKYGEIFFEDCLDEMDIVYTLSDSYNEKWRLSDRLTKAASEGWGGGKYIYAEIEGKPLFFTKLAWDSIDDAREAETAFSRYSELRFGKASAPNEWTGTEGEKVYLIRQDDLLYWMITPDTFDGDILLDLIREGSII